MEKPLTSKPPLSNPQPSRELELIGGIKNALERGEPIQKIKQSFLNAGYKPEEVNAAASRLSSVSQQQTPTQTPALTRQPIQQPKQQKQSFFSKLFSKKKQSIKPSQLSTSSPAIPTTPITPAIPIITSTETTKGFSKIWIISIIIISSLILIGAAILGLYWDKLF